MLDKRIIYIFNIFYKIYNKKNITINIMLYIIFLLIIFLLIIILLCKKNFESYENIMNLSDNLLMNNELLDDSGKNTTLNIDIKKYKQIMLNNDKKKLYKIGLNNNINILEEDCFEKCDQSNCIKLNNQKKLLKECLKCNIQKNKCYNKSIIGGNCDDCDIENIEDKIDCYDVNNFGCPNPKNLNYNNGVDPYYIQINDNNINSPYNKKCVFCWNIFNNI